MLITETVTDEHAGITLITCSSPTAWSCRRGPRLPPPNQQNLTGIQLRDAGLVVGSDPHPHIWKTPTQKIWEILIQMLRFSHAHTVLFSRLFEATTHRVRRRCRCRPTDVRSTHWRDSWCHLSDLCPNSRSLCPSSPAWRRTLLVFPRLCPVENVSRSWSFFPAAVLAPSAASLSRCRCRSWLHKINSPRARWRRRHRSRIVVSVPNGNHAWNISREGHF